MTTEIGDPSGASGGTGINRYFYARESEPHLVFDDSGFLNPRAFLKLLAPEDLVTFKCAIVTAPPWTGKSYVAKGLASWLARGAPVATSAGGAPGPVRSALTSLEAFVTGTGFCPPWWSEWAADATIGIWIIDALDEGHERESGIPLQIVRMIEDLSPQQRDRLRLVVLSRDYDVVADVEEKLAPLYTTVLGRPNYARLALAPLDRVEAEKLVAPTPIGEVVRFVDSCGLRSVAGLPVVLKYLSALQPGAQPDQTQVWRGVLQGLLAEQNRYRSEQPKTEIEEQFNSTARIAAVMTLSGHGTLRDGLRPDAKLTLADAFPMPAQRAREAAREALRSMVFVSRDGGRAFAKKHTQEWFAAFGLREIRLGRLRSLLCDSTGKTPPTLRGVAAILSRISDDPEVAGWIDSQFGGAPIPSDLVAWNLDEVTRFLDHLEDAAERSRYGLRFENTSSFRHLRVAGAAEELERRIVDKNRHVAARSAMLEVLEEVSLPAAAQLSVQLAKDPEDHAKVRQRAGWVAANHASVEQVRELMPTAANFRPTSRDEEQVLAVILIALFRHSLWTVEKVLERAPNRDRDILDTAGYLYHELRAKMSPADALVVVKAMLTGDNLAVRRASPIHELFPDAVDRLLAQDHLGDAETDSLIEIVLRELDFRAGDHDLIQKIASRLASQTDCRRHLYLRASDKCQNGKKRWLSWFISLKREDLDWLVAKASEIDPPRDHMWEEALLLTEPERNPDLDAQRRHEVRAMAEAAIAGIAQRHDDSKKRYLEQQEEQRRRQEERAAKKPAVRSIEHWIATILARNVDAGTRMRLLSRVCFGPEWARQLEMTGDWDGLSSETKETVRAHCRRGLLESSPTAIEDRKLITGDSAFEAACFQQMLRIEEDLAWVDGLVIEKWLPVVLHALTFEPEDATVMTCAERDRKATERILAQVIINEVEHFDKVLHRTRQIPDSLWSEALAQTAAALADREDVAIDARAAVLRLLTSQAPEVALPIAKRWAVRPIDLSSEADLLRATAADCWLLMEPASAWGTLYPHLTTRGQEGLLELTCLRTTDNGSVRLGEWPCERLYQLGALLFRAFPPDRYGFRNGWQGPQDELVRVRERIVPLLWERRSECAGALQQLAREFPHVKEVVEYRTANEDAAVLASEVCSPASDHLPVAQVVKAITESDYHVVRSPGDLLEAIVDALNRIVAKTVGDDVELLHDGPTGSRTRRHENALQAYLGSRLRDLLPDRFLAREVQVKYKRRPDILIVAPVATGGMAVAVIELKWSDHPDVCRALVEQLGQKYLLDEGRANGLYFVGWTGQGDIPGYTALSSEKPNTPAELRALLEQQAGAFIKSHPELDVRVCVCDCSWPE